VLACAAEEYGASCGPKLPHIASSLLTASSDWHSGLANAVPPAHNAEYVNRLPRAAT
jgi:hypothetical protein